MEERFKRERFLLNKRVEETGINDYFYLYQNAYKQIKNHYSNQDLKMSMKDIEFLINSRFIAYIIEQDLKLFIKWNYDQDRIEPAHFAVIDFLNTGEIDSKYRRGAKFLNYVPSSKSSLVMVTRGWGKTSFFCNARLLWKLYRNPNKKILLISGTEEKGKGVIKAIQKDLMRPYLSLVRPDMFSNSVKEYRDRGWTWTSTKIDINNNKSIDDMSLEELNNIYIDNMKESSIHMLTVGQDPASFHFDEAFIDDLVVPSTSETIQAMKKTDNFQKNLFPLAKDPRSWCESYTGTAWYEGTYERMRTTMTTIILPARWFDSKEKKMVYLSKWVDEAVCEREKKKDLTFFKCNYLMEPIPRHKEVNLVDNPEDFIFRFDGENVKDEKQSVLAPFKESDKHNVGAVVTSYDPSYSKLHKKWNDSSSKLALMSGTIYEGVLYIYSYKHLFGGGDIEGVYDILREHVVENRSDIVVVDSSSYQASSSETYRNWLSKDCPFVSLFIKHTKTSALSGLEGKAAKAQEILAQWFKEGLIKVHHSLIPIINEITRESRSYDFLDCFIQIIINVNYDKASIIYDGRVSRQNMPKRRNRIIERQRRNRNVNKTTRY